MGETERNERSQGRTDDAAQLASFPRADLNHASKMPYWTPSEAVAFSLDCWPFALEQAAIERRNLFHPVMLHYQSRLNLIFRAIEMADLAEKIRPHSALEWLERHEFTYPIRLREEVRKYHPYIDWKAACLHHWQESKGLQERLNFAESLIRDQFELDISSGEGFLECLDAALSVVQDLKEDHAEMSHEIVRLHEAEARETKQADISQSPDAEGDQSASYEDLDPRQQTSWMKLLLAMVMANYGHSFGASSKTAKRIERSVADTGLTLSNKTIAKIIDISEIRMAEKGLLKNLK